MKSRLIGFAALTAVCEFCLEAQPVDNTHLKQVIIFCRHAARTPVAPNSAVDVFSVLPFPTFAAAGQAAITQNGRTNETLLGGYFRLWLTQQKLLTGNDASDAAFVYARANNTPLIVDTADAFFAGLLPAASVAVNTTPTADPLFDPTNAGVATLNAKMAVAAVNGRLGGNPQSLAAAYSAELALARSVLFNYPAGALGTPSDKIVVLIASNTNISGLAGLFNLDWLVGGYQREVAALGGALVFQLRQSQRTGEYIVRAVYITQTLDQLRNRTPLTLASPPANVPVFIPGCSIQNATFDCPLGAFVRMAMQEIDSRYVDLTN